MCDSKIFWANQTYTYTFSWNIIQIEFLSEIQLETSNKLERGDTIRDE